MKNNIITDWLDEHGDPEIDKKVEKQLELEAAAENYVRNESDDTLKLISKYSFKDGAKWMEEEMEKLKDFETWKEWKNKN